MKPFLELLDNAAKAPRANGASRLAPTKEVVLSG